MAQWEQKLKDGKATGDWYALPGIEDARLAYDILTTMMPMDDDLRAVAKGVLRVWGQPIADVKLSEAHEDAEPDNA
jgi:hypothetical protein